MPFKLVEPEIAIEHFGITVYHGYDECITDQYTYIFNTSILEEEEYEFDIRDTDAMSIVGSEIATANQKDKFNTDEIVLMAIKLAIERQEIDLPDGIDHKYTRGCFNWYIKHPSLFIAGLSSAAMHADIDNARKLNIIYPHLINSKAMESWNDGCSGFIIDAPAVFEIKPDIVKDNAEMGSFNLYLNRSGNFVTHLSNAIRYAGITHRSTIEEEYPQMVAGYNIDWNKAPDGFRSPTYNSKKE